MAVRHPLRSPRGAWREADTDEDAVRLVDGGERAHRPGRERRHRRRGRHRQETHQRCRQRQRTRCEDRRPRAGPGVIPGIGARFPGCFMKYGCILPIQDCYFSNSRRNLHVMDASADEAWHPAVWTCGTSGRRAQTGQKGVSVQSSRAEPIDDARCGSTPRRCGGIIATCNDGVSGC